MEVTDLEQCELLAIELCCHGIALRRVGGVVGVIDHRRAVGVAQQLRDAALEALDDACSAQDAPCLLFWL